MLYKSMTLIYSFLLLIANPKNHSVDNNIIYIDNLKCYLNFLDWHFSDDERLLGKIKTVITETDTTGIIKASIDNIGIQFFVLEKPFGTPMEFNTNINLTVEDLSDYPGIKDLEDYLLASKNQLKLLFEHYKILSETIKDINGFECGIMELDYNQKIGNQTYELSCISMTIMKDRKAYIFTGTALRKEFKTKKQIIEKILYSINTKK